MTPIWYHRGWPLWPLLSSRRLGREIPCLSTRVNRWYHSTIRCSWHRVVSDSQTRGHRLRLISTSLRGDTPWSPVSNWCSLGTTTDVPRFYACFLHGNFKTLWSTINTRLSCKRLHCGCMLNSCVCILCGTRHRRCWHVCSTGCRRGTSNTNMKKTTDLYSSCRKGYFCTKTAETSRITERTSLRGALIPN